MLDTINPILLIIGWWVLGIVSTLIIFFLISLITPTEKESNG